MANNRKLPTPGDDSNYKKMLDWYDSPMRNDRDNSELPMLIKGVHFGEALAVLNEWLHKLGFLLNHYNDGRWYLDNLSNREMLGSYPTFAQAFDAALVEAEKRICERKITT